jgi:prophage regulatory protein
MRVLSYGDLQPQKGIPFSRQWIHELIKQGKFPAPFSLGERAVGFLETEIDDWIAARVRERDSKANADGGVAA